MTTVALVAHRIADQTPSGIGRYYREIIAALAIEAAGTKLVAVTPREPGYPEWLPAGVTRRCIPGPRRVLQFCWSAGERPRIDAWTGGADLVHALHTWAPVPTRRPLVVTVHDLMPVVNPGWYRRDHRWASGRALRVAAERADRIIADSRWVARLLQSECGVSADRVSVIPLGAGDRFRSTPTTAEWRAVQQRWGLVPGGYVLALGQVAPRKNLLTVVRAMAKLGPQRAALVPLAVAGSPGPATAEVEAEVARLGLGTAVRMLGYVPEAHLVALVAGALVLVHPSADEGFGLTPIEAMAAGTPVIASRSGSLEEVVGGAGVLVDSDDVDGWAEAIGRVVADEDERHRLAAAGRTRQAAFTWAETARATLSVYRNVLEGRATS